MLSVVMLSVANKPIILSVVMLNVVMLSVVAPAIKPQAVLVNKTSSLSSICGKGSKLSGILGCKTRVALSPTTGCSG